VKNNDEDGHMKTLISTALLLIALSLSALAQTSNSSRGQGYFFVAPGVTEGNSRLSAGASFHIGGGGEGFVYKGLGVGAEIGAVGPLSDFSNQYFGMGSVNLSYHFLPSATEPKLEPFVNLGYTLFFRAGVTHGGHAGFGLNRWLNKNIALRFEIRDHVEFAANRGHLLDFRIGVTLR
jgi:hypothetical protein